MSARLAGRTKEASMAPRASTTPLPPEREQAPAIGPDRPSESLARLVAARRAELGLTQRELADRMGSPVAAVGRIESGLHAPRFETLERLFRALESRLVVGYETGPGRDAAARRGGRGGGGRRLRPDTRSARPANPQPAGAPPALSGPGAQPPN
jgi:transcriptional regulator with XRE-family HTH domain